MPLWGYGLLFVAFIGGLVTLFRETEEERAQVHVIATEDQTRHERTMQQGLNQVLKKNQPSGSLQEMMQGSGAVNIRAETEKRRTAFCSDQTQESVTACEARMQKTDFACQQVMGSAAQVACLDRIYPPKR